MLRRELTAIAGRAGRRPGPVAAGLHRAARLPGRVQRARPRLGQAGRALAGAHREAVAPGPGRRRRHRLPARHARAADRARPRRAPPTGRAGRGDRDHAQRAGRRRARRQVHPAAAASTCGCACSPRSASARRTSACCACARANGELVPLSALVRQEEHPTLQAITRRDRERAITVFANVAPGPLAGRGDRATSSSWARRCRRLRARQLAGQSVTFQESMLGARCSRSSLGICVAYMVLASQFNSLLHPITVLTTCRCRSPARSFAL